MLTANPFPQSGIVAAMVTSALIVAMATLAPAVTQAAAQGDWVLPASEVSPEGQNAGAPQLAFSADGTTTAVWIDKQSGNNNALAATRSPGEAFGAPTNLTHSTPGVFRPMEDAQVAVAPDGTTTAVWMDVGEPNLGGYHIFAATRPPGGTFGPPVRLSDLGDNHYDPQIVAVGDGTTTVAWRRGDTAGTIQAATRPPGGTFGTPVDVSAVEQDIQDLGISAAADGTINLIWQMRTTGSTLAVKVATRPAGGSFDTPVEVSPLGESSQDPMLATAPDGTATAVWRNVQSSPHRVQTATRAPGEESFGPTETLSTGSQNGTEPAVAVDPDGNATVVWTYYLVSPINRQVVQARTRPAGGSFGPTLQLSENAENATNPQIAASPDGTVTSIWTYGADPDQVVQAATRPVGGSFAPPVKLAPPGAAASSLRLAIGPFGTATALWTRSNGTNTILWQASTGLPELNLTVSKSGTGTGAVKSSPAGIDCGPNCSAGFPAGTTVTLSAVAASGSTFSGWSGACAGSAGATCEVEMLESAEAKATFNANPVPPGPPAPTCRKATLKWQKVLRNRKKGIARVKVKVGMAGKLTLKGSKQVRKATRKAGKAGSYKLKVKAKGKAAKRLRRKGQVKIKARVAFKATGCRVKTRSKKIKLISL